MSSRTSWGPKTSSPRVKLGALGACLAALVGAPRALPASGGSGDPSPGVLVTLEEALELSFAGARAEKKVLYLTESQVRAAEELAGEKLPSAIVHTWVATRRGASGAEEVVGVAYADAHRVRTLGETLLVVVDPRERVQRVEVVAFAEPRDYLPRAAFYAQFKGRKLDDELALKRGIRGVSGATLTSRATTAAVRRALAIHRALRQP